MRNIDEIRVAIENGEHVPPEELIKFFHYGSLDSALGNEEGKFNFAELYNDLTGKNAQREAAETEKQLQEDSQDFAHNERIEQNDWELELHKLQLLNDPTLQMQGLKAAGFSDAAASQAIFGSQGSFGIGAASNGAAPMGSVSPVPPQSGLMDVLSSIPQKLQDVKKLKSDVKLNRQKVLESSELMRKYGQEIKASEKNIELAIALNESTIGLNSSVAARNFAELSKIESEATLNLAKAGLVEKEGLYLDAQTAHEWALSSLTQKQAVKVQQEIDEEIVKKTGQVLQNQASLYSSQDKAQQAENYGLYLRNQVAKVMGCEPDADIVTQVMESIVTGHYFEVSKIVGINQLSGNTSLYGLLERSLTDIMMQIFGIDKGLSGVRGPYEP